MILLIFFAAFFTDSGDFLVFHVIKMQKPTKSLYNSP
jgi:hypothetical protein